jgi:alpha-L-fucosidase
MSGATARTTPDDGWFAGAGLGLFVHWDHASRQGLEISWPLVGGNFALPHCQSVSVEQYHSSARDFDPAAWDAGGLARLAHDTGATYAVLTAKHHSGYAMFHTERSELSIEHSRFGRDIVREFVDAVRAEGLRVGLYFSLSDWSAPDYPAFTDADKPYRFGLSPPMPEPARWERYLDHLFGQVTELLTHYGRIDLLWFDGGWERAPAAWKGRELLERIRSLQPDILVNDRLPGGGGYQTPEQFVPPQAPGRAWETCMTMNESWGYNPTDTDYKPARALIHTLCEVAGRGGNLLLNVSPRGDGSLPPEQLERLAAIGAWMRVNRESVSGVEAGLEPWQFYGPSTRRGDRVYLHLLMQPYDSVAVRGVPVRRVERVRALTTGTELRFTARTGIIESLMDDPTGELTIDVPRDVIDEHATVLAIDIAREPGAAA